MRAAELDLLADYARIALHDLFEEARGQGPFPAHQQTELSHTHLLAISRQPDDSPCWLKADS